MVAFDLDGTLVGADLTIHPRVAAAVEAMRGRGIQGCIVTGRMYRGALPFARQLHFDAPVVCYQGAAVVDPATDDVLFDTPLPNREALEVEAFARAHGLHVQLYANDRYYCERRNRFSDFYAHISGVDPVIVPSLRDRFRDSDATKACLIADREVVDEKIAALQTQLGTRAYVTRSLPVFIEVMHPRVDKGKALTFVAQRMGIGTSDVLAIGDSWNDGPLLLASGFGIAMGSAPQELRDVADAVVADAAGDGVAEALERFVLA